MAIGTATAIGLGASALGGFLSSRSQSRRNRQLQDMMQQGPSPLEMQGMGWLMGAQGFNPGQDGGLQSMRSSPIGQSQNALSAIIEAQGNPFNLTDAFNALAAQDTRSLNASVADLQAMAPGLGARFGTASRLAESDLRARALENAAARNSLLGFQSHTDAQGRLLSAIGLQQQGGLAQQQQQQALLQLLMGAQANRLGTNAQLLAGQTGSPWGSFFGDIGATAILPNLFRGPVSAPMQSQTMFRR